MMMNPIKTKILTLSVAVALGLGGLTFLVSGNGLNLGGEVMRNTHLELMQLNVLDDASTPLSEQNPQVEMKMQGDTLVSAVSDGKKEIAVSNKLTGDASAF